MGGSLRESSLNRPVQEIVAVGMGKQIFRRRFVQIGLYDISSGDGRIVVTHLVQKVDVLARGHDLLDPVQGHELGNHGTAHAVLVMPESFSGCFWI